jgi:hypothetical protein
VIEMVSLLGKIGALGLIVVLVLGAFFIPAGADDSRAVDYELGKEDPSGDSEGFFGDSVIEANADILGITTEKSGDNIVFTMVVSGTIHLFDSVYTTAYQFSIDIDGDDSYDWLLTKSQFVNFKGTDSQLQDDHESAPTLYYLDNATGDETDTLTMQFPLSYITDVETVESWNVYGSSSVVQLSTGATYVDTAPDDEFTDTGGGNGGDPTKNEDIHVTIQNPEADEKIPAGDTTDVYRIEGVVTPPIGDTIDHMTYRVLEAKDPGWQTVLDDSGNGDYSTWYAEMSTYAVQGSGNLANGKNTLEVSATTLSGDFNTATVIFYFNSDDDETDNDGDGMPNDYETENGLDPEDPSDAGEDPDDDGYSNFEEYKAETDPKDSSDYPGAGGNGGNGYDPSTEEPTDKLIKVSISSAKFVYKDNGDGTFKNDILISGTTSGVKYCELLFVPYVNGKPAAEEDWISPFDWEEEASIKAYLETQGYTANWFKSTSGSDDWKTWELKISGDVNSSEDDDSEFLENLADTDKVVVYVRAYSDNSGNNWNQASREIKSSDDDKDDNGGDSPGFEAVFTIIALGAVVLISRVYYRRK